MMRMIRWVGVSLVAILIVVAFALLLTVPVMLLWNWVGVDVLRLPRITLAQAWGLLTLSAILFKTHSTHTKSK